MWKKKKIMLYFFALLCVFFLIIFWGQVVYAMKPNVSSISSNTSNNVSNLKINGSALSNFIKLMGGSLLVTITASITIYKTVLERGYDVEKIEIDLINRRPPQNNKYTDYECGKIYLNNTIIKQMDVPNPCYLDIFIKIRIPNGKKPLNDIVIKKLVLNMNGYKIICNSKNKKIGKSSRVRFNQDKEKCEILLKWPTIKEENCRILLNPIKVFRNPIEFDMYLVWYPVVVLSKLAGFVLPKKKIFVFEKIEHVNGSARIGIKSKGIYEGNKYNG